MVTVQIDGVPEEVRDALAADAKAHGQSLQAYLLKLMETQARRLANRAILDARQRSLDSAQLRGLTAQETSRSRNWPTVDDF